MVQTNGTTAALPPTRINDIAPGIRVLHPLSRRGTGPGVIVVVEETGLAGSDGLRIENGVPSAVMKWAEEGFTVAEVVPEAWSNSEEPLHLASKGLAECESCEPKEKVGIICESLPDTVPGTCGADGSRKVTTPRSGNRRNRNSSLFPVWRAWYCIRTPTN